MFTRTILAAAALLCLSVSLSVAQPPSEGFHGHIVNRPVLHCWTEPDVRELVGEYQADFDAGFALFKTKHAAGRCGIIRRLGPVRVSDVELMGPVDLGKGKRAVLWIVKVSNGAKQTWIVYDEPAPDTLA
ncbi:hypothetical protein [Bauldia sp.]|uniref:hypothetical protein n=1 Tax=Bauldia sp. TaxID=2575872 RepID=UPI003BA962E1